MTGVTSGADYRRCYVHRWLANLLCDDVNGIELVTETSARRPVELLENSRGDDGCDLCRLPAKVSARGGIAGNAEQG